MRKTIWITLLTLAAVTGWFAPAPEAHAIDPVTIAILTPAAMRMAETAQPYVIQGMLGGARGLAQIGMAAFKILYNFHNFRCFGTIRPVDSQLFWVLCVISFIGSDSRRNRRCDASSVAAPPDNSSARSPGSGRDFQRHPEQIEPDDRRMHPNQNRCL